MYILKQKVTFIILLFASFIFSNEYILEINNKKYSEYDIQNIMNEYDLQLPDEAINILQQEAVYLNENKTKDQLYSKFFGVSFSLDKKKIQARDLPVISRQANSRARIFNKWVNNKARFIPVKYLDMKAYWEMVKKTYGYQIRKEAGRTLSSNQISFTFAELQLSPTKILAVKNDSVLLSGIEYNDYINNNYNQIRAFVKRDKKLGEVQNYLIKRILGEKIISEYNFTPFDSSDELQLEREVQSFVEQNKFNQDINLVGKQNISPAKVQEDLYLSYKLKNTKKLDVIKRALCGKINRSSLDRDIQTYVMQRKLLKIKKDISKQITSKQIYGWMEENNFTASFNEAHHVISTKKYQNLVENSLLDDTIELSLINN